MPRTIPAEQYKDDVSLALVQLNGDGTVTLYEHGEEVPVQVAEKPAKG